MFLFLFAPCCHSMNSSYQLLFAFSINGVTILKFYTTLIHPSYKHENVEPCCAESQMHVKQQLQYLFHFRWQWQNINMIYLFIAFLVCHEGVSLKTPQFIFIHDQQACERQTAIKITNTIPVAGLPKLQFPANWYHSWSESEPFSWIFWSIVKAFD